MGETHAKMETDPTVNGPPYVELKEALGGYIMVKASNLSEATELAKNCPILSVGRSVEVRAIEKRSHHHLYFILLGELYTGVDHSKALIHFKTAYTLAKTQTDKQSIQKKMDELNS